MQLMPSAGRVLALPVNMTSQLLAAGGQRRHLVLITKTGARPQGWQADVLLLRPMMRVQGGLLEPQRKATLGANA